MKKGTFRAVTGGGGSDAAKNRSSHIPHRIPDQLAGSIKSAQSKAKAGHMKIHAPSGAKLPFSL
jgi:hypothetical protein